MDNYQSLTAKGIEAYTEVLTEIGWFDTEQNDKQTFLERVKRLGDSVDYMFNLYCLWFDAEGFEDDEPYNNLLNEILELVNLEIVSKKVDYQSDDNSVNISLTTEKSTYTYSIPLDDFGDWFDEELITVFINQQVLAGENVSSRFFALPSSDQTTQFVFVPQETYDKAIAKGVIPAVFDYFSEEE